MLGAASHESICSSMLKCIRQHGMAAVRKIMMGLEGEVSPAASHARQRCSQQAAGVNAKKGGGSYKIPQF